MDAIDRFGESLVAAGRLRSSRPWRHGRLSSRALLVGGTAVAALAVAVALLIAGLGAGTPGAFAGWTLAPSRPPASQAAAADRACRARLARAPRTGVPAKARAGLPSPRLSIAAARWRGLITDTRGPFTMTLYEADGGREETSCLARSSPALLYLGSTVLAGRPAPVRAGQISVVSLGSSVTPARDGDRAFRQVIGRTGRGVRGVVLKLGDGARVTASVSDGWFLAWWPGRSRFAAAEVTAGAGTLQR